MKNIIISSNNIYVHSIYQRMKVVDRLIKYQKKISQLDEKKDKKKIIYYREKIKKITPRSTHIYNCNRGAIDHRDYVLSLSGSTDKAPTLTSVDLRLTCPSVYDQGQLGSCVANGTAYNVEYNQIKAKMSHQFTPSRLFIYYNTRVLENTVTIDSGTTIRGALTAVSKQGTCPESLWPYNTTKFAVKPSTQAYQSGNQHLVKTYTRVQFDLTQMKRCLSDGYPFIFGMILYTSFEFVGTDGKVPVPQSGETVLGGHCMACVGFNDANKSFIVRNSWGSNWGDHGYCYIPYSYMCNPSTTFDLWSIRMISDTESKFNNIKSITYGQSKSIDVTEIVKNYFATGKTSILIGNQLFGDPMYGVRKQMKVTYVDNKVKVYREGETLRLTELLSSTIIIRTANLKRALYGMGNRWIDVTSIINDRFSQGYPQLTAGNQLFTDPCFGVVKQLKLTLVDGTTKTFTESETMTINDLDC